MKRGRHEDRIRRILWGPGFGEKKGFIPKGSQKKGTIRSGPIKYYKDCRKSTELYLTEIRSSRGGLIT